MTWLKLPCSLTAAVFLVSCIPSGSKTGLSPPPVPSYIEAPEEVPQYRLRLLAAGDNLFHDTMIRRALTPEETYNFTPVYSEIKSLIEEADLAFINQETVMAGDAFGYSGFPLFNTPQALAKTLTETGFDIVNHANNHALDMGEKGILAAMDTWDEIPEIVYLGISRSLEKKHAVLVKNNISIGFLAYTYYGGEKALLNEKPWLVSLINREAMAADIKALRPLCDFLVVSMHWGEEYSLEPTAAQKSLAKFLAEQNVDLVIGHHPHVLEYVEALPRPDGKTMLCFYSLGNFIANQWEKETILGGLLYVELVKKGEEVSFGKTGLIPVVSHFEQGFTKTRIIPLYAYTEELMEKHQLRTREKKLNVEYFYSLLKNLKTRIIMYNPFQEYP